MSELVKSKGNRLLSWVANNPKKFFTYSMIFLSVSFIGSIIQGIFFPSETNFKIKTPILYSKTQTAVKAIQNKDKEMEKIVEELKSLKAKRDQNELKKTDSLRIEYLYNQYQELKNGH